MHTMHTTSATGDGDGLHPVGPAPSGSRGNQRPRRIRVRYLVERVISSQPFVGEAITEEDTEDKATRQARRAALNYVEPITVSRITYVDHQIARIERDIAAY